MKLSPFYFTVFFFSTLAGLVLLSNCGGVDSVYYDGRTCVQGIGPASTGADIYQAACASCHGQLQNWNKGKVSASTIQTAISSTIPSMRYLNCLTADQINSIASALP